MTDGRSRPAKALGCFGKYLNEMQIGIDWPLVSTAVFAGGVECNPPGIEEGGSDNAAALWLSLGVRSLEEDRDPFCSNLALPSSLSFIPRGKRQGRPRPGVLK